tara:strand:- start:6440 stop:6997 length:558 start_codon:yes stop_codon:yes gene_type:complete
MSRRYATVTNLQADGVEGGPGQRDAFKKGESEFGISDVSRSKNIFPDSPISSGEYDPEVVYEAVIDGNRVNDNPDFLEGVNLNYSAADREPLLSGADLSDLNETVTDKPQYGAPNITSPNVNAPFEARETTSDIERKEAGFGTREVAGDNVNDPQLTRERIGNYFTTSTRRTERSLGTSKPVVVS